MKKITLLLVAISLSILSLNAQTYFDNYNAIALLDHTNGTVVHTNDFDSDGDNDFLVYKYISNKISWYRNIDGNGMFGEEIEITSSENGVSDVYSCDIDGDGDNDIITTSYSDNNTAWYENLDGNGTFGTQQIISTDTQKAREVFACDIDGDGDYDVISGFQGFISWFENLDGNGNFGSIQIITNTLISVTDIYAVDIDNDGDNDILSSSNGDDKICWFENIDGNGNFGSQQIISSTADGANIVRSNDIDGDGDYDIISSSGVDKKLAWYENTDGIGTFGTEQIISLAAGGYIEVYDLDNDGDYDIVSSALGNIEWFKNNGSGIFGSIHNITTDNSGSISSCDIDGDNDIDVVSGTGGVISLYKNLDGNGKFNDIGNTISIIADGANDVYSCDLDGDGDNDVISASDTDDKIAWYENVDGDGSFSSQQIITTSADGAKSVYACDLDGDGDNDILSASSNDDKIAWYENTDGLGTFGNEQIISASANYAISVYAGDLDGDGDNDIVSASLYDDKIAWYENLDGNGTFSAEIIISTSADGAGTVYICDINGDGNLDILAATRNNNRVIWFENTDGLGTFGAEQIISSVTWPYDIHSTDIDGDGDNDVLAVSTYYDNVIWFENTDGLGTFGSAQQIEGDLEHVCSVYSTDVDSDGDNDVIACSYTTNEVVWYENIDGNGQFNSKNIISSFAEYALSVFSCDIDGDGDNDILSASRDDDKIAWYGNTNGFGSFGSSDNHLISSNGGDVFASDIDSDGDNDMLFTTSQQVFWTENLDGEGNLGAKVSLTPDVSGIFEFITCDIDSDGDDDIVSAFTDDNKISWFENLDGLGTFSSENIINLATTAPTSIFSCDIDGDDDLDIIAGSSTYTTWYENLDGSGMFGGMQIIGWHNWSFYEVFANDLDNDSDFDVIKVGFGYNGFNTGSGLSWYENTDGDGTFGANQIIQNSESYYQAITSADFDYDGDNDIIVYTAYDNKIIYFKNNGSGTFGYAETITSGDLYPNKLFAKDIDLDGKIDIISSSENKVAWYKNEGNYFGDQIVISSSLDSDDIFSVDMDGDGDFDVLSSSGSDNLVKWYENFTLQIFSQPINQNVQCNSNTSFSITANDYKSIQWQVDDNTGFVDIYNNAQYSGVNSETLQINNTTGDINGYEYRCVVSNPAGSLISDTVLLIVEDNIEPVPDVSTLADIYEECSATLTAPTATDDCVGSVTGTTITPFPITTQGTTIVTWTYDDGSGNIVTQDQNVYINDVTGPVHDLSTLPDVTDECTVSLTAPTSTDNCVGSIDGTTTTTFPITSSGTTIVTWSYDDGNGNITTQNQNVTITDITDPIITSTHNNQIVDADANCEATLLDYTGNVTATDNCDTELEVTQNPITGTAITGLTNTVTLTVNDDAGNTDEISFNIEVIDQTNPVITSTHNDQSIGNGTECEVSIPDYVVDIVATDNCDTNLDITQNPIAGTIISGATNTVTLTVTDDAGNTDEVTFNVEVIDNTSPVINSTHNDQAVDADANCEASLPDYTGDVTATDNCDAELDVTQNPTAGTIISGTTNTVTLTVTDDAGNTDDVSFNVEVVDNTNPSVTCVSNQTVMADDESNTYTIQGTEFDPVTTDDNCTVASIINDFNSSSTLDGAVLSLGTTTIEWTIQDGAGNSNSCSFDVLVEEYIDIAELQELGIFIYPNPSNGIFRIETVDSYVISVSDITGKKLIEIESEKGKTEIDLSNYSNGTYFIEFKNSEYLKVAKIIKK